MYGTKAAAIAIYASMQERGYSTASWSEHELHPKASEGFSDVDVVNFIFTMDLLNFSYVRLILSQYAIDQDPSTDLYSASGPNSQDRTATKWSIRANVGLAITASSPVSDEHSTKAFRSQRPGFGGAGKRQMRSFDMSSGVRRRKRFHYLNSESRS